MAALVFIIGAEPFEVPGQNPIGERLGGAVAVAVIGAAVGITLGRRARAARAHPPARGA